MRILILISICLSLAAFQNCSEASFSDAGSAGSGKLGADETLPEPGPALDEVAEEDRPAVHERYRCENYDDDSESSDDGDSDSESSDDENKVWICHNDHLICISESALRAHLMVHVDMHGDEYVDNYGGCDYDDDSDSSDDDDSESSDDDQSDS